MQVLLAVTRDRARAAYRKMFDPRLSLRIFFVVVAAAIAYNTVFP